MVKKKYVSTWGMMLIIIMIIGIGMWLYSEQNIAKKLTCKSTDQPEFCLFVLAYKYYK